MVLKTILQLLPIVGIIGVIVMVFVIFQTGYVKAGPDEAWIITGFRKTPRVLIGRSGIRIPFLERKDHLIMRQISIDIKTNGYIPTKDFIGVDIDAIAKIQIMNDEKVQVATPDGTKEMRGIDIAARNFLNMSEAQIITALTDSLQGNMREIIGTVDLKELCNDRKKFGDQVQEKAQKDMNALGINIISCNIQRITDENELINALGQDNMAQIQKNASIAKAQADRDVAIAKAEAAQQSNEAEVNAKKVIAERNNALNIRQFELQKNADIEKAKTDAAYKIQEQEQAKTINEAMINAEIAKTEREAELKEKEVSVTERSLEATVKRQADAEKYKIEKEAEAQLAKRQREAEATKYEQQMAADAQKAKAEADKFAAEQEAAGIKAKYDAEAAGISARGLAEAAAVKAKGLAEAEAMEKKAEAYKKYNNAAIIEMMVKVLPDMVSAAAKPIEAIDNLNIYASDSGQDGNAMSGVTGTTPVLIKQVFDTMKNTTGVDLADIMRAETYDAKVNKKIDVSGLPEGLIQKSDTGNAKDTGKTADTMPDQYVSLGPDPADQRHPNEQPFREMKHSRRPDRN